MNFKNIPQKHRPIPFWSWNEKLNCEETKSQIVMMHKAGIGGFFMHARGGLQTEYMGTEWFDNVACAVDEAKKCKIRPWAYDENGWPSGFGDGKVNALGTRYQQKYLRVEKINEHRETHIAKCGDYYFYYEVNPFYVDTLDKDVIKEFIKISYEPYYQKFGTDIEGFFTDEPQVTKREMPWSFAFEKEYKARYNEDIKDHLDELFFEVNNYKATRIKFWKMVTELFSESYMKQIYDWCSQRGLKVTGHLLMEETLESQIATSGACMPHYEYFHIPGMDWLGRGIFDNLNHIQVASVAQQLDKEAVLSETFALCGHNVNFHELKGIYEWQMVHGINLLCQHLEGYSLRGMRKRDYPPAMYYQQPWWSVYDKFIDAMSRVGMLLNTGKAKADVLVIEPMTTAWTMFNSTDNPGLKELDNKFLDLIKSIEKKHIQYHIGDEIIIERHGYVQDGELVIGTQKYSKLIISHCEELLDNTKNILKKFVQNGGTIITTDELEANKVISSEDITYTVRYFDDYTMHYFVNTSSESKNADVYISGKAMDIYTGELSEFSGSHQFEPWGSLVLIEDGSKNISADNADFSCASLCDEFIIAEEVENAFTLDYCDYYFDGELQGKNAYVLNITQRACALERKVNIHQDYFVNVKEVPEKIHLVCETPHIFKITINGNEIEKNICGSFVDKSFKRIDVAAYIKKGTNTISFDCEFEQSPEVYENIKKAYLFESERNKLVYDMEIEPVYLVGDFSANTNGEWTELEKNAERYKGMFEISVPKRKLNLADIHKQGYPFFCGELKLEGEIDIPSENSVLTLNTCGINAVRVEVGDVCQTIFTPGKLSLASLKGKHPIKLTLINNLRNLLGPHHLEEGECQHVSPLAFYHEKCVWNHRRPKEWNHDYCFVKMGIY